jgi:hypothetical protein
MEDHLLMINVRGVHVNCSLHLCISISIVHYFPSLRTFNHVNIGVTIFDLCVSECL